MKWLVHSTVAAPRIINSERGDLALDPGCDIAGAGGVTPMSTSCSPSLLLPLLLRVFSTQIDRIEPDLGPPHPNRSQACPDREPPKVQPWSRAGGGGEKAT